MFHLKRLTNFCPHDVGHYLGKLRNKTSCKICEKCTQFKEPLYKYKSASCVYNSCLFME